MLVLGDVFSDLSKKQANKILAQKPQDFMKKTRILKTSLIRTPCRNVRVAASLLVVQGHFSKLDFQDWVFLHSTWKLLFLGGSDFSAHCSLGGLPCVPSSDS